MLTEAPTWVHAAQAVLDSAAVGADVELETLVQEKVYRPRQPSHAGFTCTKCPNPLRPLPDCVCEPYNGPVGYTEGYDDTPSIEGGCRPCQFYGLDGFIPAVGCGLPIVYTSRCPDCQRGIKRWMKGKKISADIEMLRSLDDAVSAAFVTLTIPNVLLSPPIHHSDVVREIRRLKTEVAKWRRTSGVGDHFIGGFDFYEVTGCDFVAGTLDGVTEGEISLNVHHHGVWVQGGFWKQAEMQEAWGRGIVHIKRVASTKQALRYLTSYAGKEPVRGVRTQERWGCCRGTVLSALRESVRQRETDASDARDASDSDVE